VLFSVSISRALGCAGYDATLVYPLTVQT